MSPSFTSTDDKTAYSSRSARTETDEAKNDLRVAADQAGRKVREFVDSASEELTQAGDAITARVNEKPVQSALVALGVGFLLGALLRR